MGITVTTSQVKSFLRNTGKKTTRASRRQIEVEAEKIKKLSQDYSPRDKGPLEDSHFVKKSYGDDRRKVMEIGFEAEHGFVVHENLSGQRFGLGEESIKKAQRLGLTAGTQIGPKFLERAVDDLEPETIKNMKEALEKL